MTGLFGGVSAGANQGIQSGALQKLQALAAGRAQQTQGMSTHQLAGFLGSGLTPDEYESIMGMPDRPLTVIGQGEGWLSPEELRERTNGLNSTLTWGGGSGGSSGGGGSSSGGGLGGGSSSTTPGNSSSSSQQPGGGLLGGTIPGTNMGAVQYPNGAPVGFGQPSSGGQLPGIQPGSSGGQTSYPSPGGGSGGASPQAGSAMNNYLSSAGNQLLGDPSYARFQNSPGYQYAVDEAMRQVQRGGAARGLLESGAVMRDMTDRAQGMALQDYGNWWNRQNQLFGDYQNRLAGLAGGPTGADQAYGLGQSLGAGSQQMGSNLGSLFGNQGMGGFGGMVNTGAAQANNTIQAGNTQAQIQSVNQATQLANTMLQPAVNQQRRF